MSLLALTGFAFLGAAILLAMHEIGPFIVVHRPIILGPLFAGLVGEPAAGFAIGAMLEWVWTDRIPAGGIRTPASAVGAVAGVLAWVGMAAVTPVAARFAMALMVATLYVAAFVPFDGGLRRLWNVASENTIAALERGSVVELTALLPVALIFRVVALGVSLIAAPYTAAALWAAIGNSAFGAALTAVPWHWTIAAAAAALLLRVGGQVSWIGPALFAAGAVAGWYL